MASIDFENLNKEHLHKELRDFIAEAEELMRAVGRHGGEQLDDAKARFAEKLKLAKLEMEKTEVALMGRAREAARATDRYVHENPWKTAGVAAAIGLLAGMLLGRR